MNNTIKKISACLLATALAFSSGITAFADTPGSSNIVGSGSQATKNASTVTTGSTFTLTKEIALFNPSSSQIYEPNVKYTYAIANVDPNGATVTDESSHVAVVKEGKGGVSISYTENASGGTDGIYFGQTDEKINTNEESAVSSASIFSSRTATISVDPSVFVNASNQPQPGIYRYSITETMNDSTNGVVHNATEPLFLDVYVRFNNENALEVYGFALFRDSDKTEKVTGFDHSSTSKELVDEYHTYNNTIKKTVSGSLGDKNNNFPFQANLAGTNGNAELWYVATMDGVAGSAEKVALDQGSLKIGDATSTGQIKLQHNDTLVIYGIPVATTVDVTEYNNTADTYNSSIANIAAGNSSSVSISASSIAASETAKTTAALTVLNNNGYANTSITFNNELAEVSPTNVMLRFAPYILMMLAGIALIGVGLKSKNKNNISSI